MTATATPRLAFQEPALPTWLAAVSPPARAAFFLRTQDGLDYAAIGARLGCSRPEVVTLLRTARDAGCIYRPWEDAVPPAPPRWLVPRRPSLASSLLQVWWVLPTGALLLVFGWLWLLFLTALYKVGLREAALWVLLQRGTW